MSLKSMLFAASAVIYAALANGEVHKLTVDTFDSFIKENPLSLVKFYAPWCGHCKSLAPHYEAASEKLPEGVKLAEVDVTEQEALGTRFEIRGFPTMKFFRDGTPEEYTGGRTTETILDWISLMTTDPVTMVESAEKAREHFPEDVLIVATFKKDSEESKTFQKLAEANRLLGRFVAAEGEPSMKVMRVGESEGVETTFGEEADMISFIKNERLPYFGPVSGETFAAYMETGLDFIWFAGTEDDMESVSEEMNKIGKEFRGKFNIVWLDTDAFARQADGMLGVSEFPALVRTIDGPGRYLFGGESMTVDTVKEWISEMEDGKIVPQLKSEPVPDSNDEPVKVVVGSEFDKIVTDDKDVLLEIYAPWCGHCKKLAPVYEEVAEKIQTLNPNMVIAKIDGTANEIATEGYEFQGFPTIYYKKAGEKPAPYQGGRELGDIMSFLAENATEKFEWSGESADKEAHDEL